MKSATLRETEKIERRVREAGLRPTRQRVALANLLFAQGDRHLSAEELHEEAISAGVPVSLATVYNTLHQFTEAGLLRILAVEGARTYLPALATVLWSTSCSWSAASTLSKKPLSSGYCATGNIIPFTTSALLLMN